MIFKDTGLPGAYVVEPERLEDSRGFFARAWCQKEFEKAGLEANFVQCNLSFNTSKGTVRGMHFQKHPYQEVKLVRCTRGEIFDVIVDLVPTSVTYSKWFGIHLTEKNHTMLYVPKNYAHGYQTLCDGSEVFYQVSQFYVPGSEEGLRWDDAELSIQWPINEKVTISEKDKNWPDFFNVRETGGEQKK
jgi:dTDP-4-dehydrorhamnose 3,5-epimerase